MTAPAGEPPQGVDTGDDLRPGLETYPRWAVIAFLFGPLILAGYFTPGVGWFVTTCGAIAGMFVAHAIAWKWLVQFFTTGPGGPRKRTR